MSSIYEVSAGYYYPIDIDFGIDFSSIGEVGSSCTLGWVEQASIRAEIENATGYPVAPLVARIDEIRMYHGEAADMNLFDRSINWNYGSEPGLVAVWPITETSGNIITDEIGGRNFTIVNDSNCLQPQLGDQCPPPTFTSFLELPQGGSVDITLRSLDHIPWTLEYSTGSSGLDVCAVSVTCDPPQPGEVVVDYLTLRLQPNRAACGSVINFYTTANLSALNNVSVDIESIPFTLLVNQTSLPVSLSGGNFQLTGNFGQPTSSLDGTNEFTFLQYNHDELVSAQLTSSVNSSGLYVLVPEGYGTAVLVIRMCGQTKNVSVSYPAPQISAVKEKSSESFTIEGQNFPTSKTWNTNDVIFTESDGKFTTCTVGTVTETSIECSIGAKLSAGKIHVKMTVGDQTAEFSFDQKGGKKTNVGVIVGPVVAGVVVISAVVGFLLYRKQQKKKTSNNDHNNMEMAGTYANVGNPSVSAIQDKWNIDYKEISIQKQIGKGGFGVIYLAKWRNTDCVVKQLERNNATEEFLKEANNVRLLRPHPNICTVLGVCTSPEHPLCLVMEYVQQGSLWTMLSTGQLLLDPQMVLDFAIDIANGMHHLHSENIIHCDLACRNILVATKSTTSFTLKITDFGLSRVMDSELYKASEHSMFPVRWASPELLSKSLITKALDVWAYGITLWEMIEVKQPYFELPSNSEVIQAVCRGTRLTRPSMQIPDSLWTLMETCWAENPSQRPTFADITNVLNQIKNQQAATVHENAQQTVAYFSAESTNYSHSGQNSNYGNASQQPTHYSNSNSVYVQSSI